MAKWRRIMTDRESLSGVAPVCVATEHEGDPNGPDIQDCCRQPWIQCVNELESHVLAYALTYHNISPFMWCE